MAMRLVFILATAAAVAIRATRSPRDSPVWRYARRGRRAGTAAARRPFRLSPRTGFVRRRTCASRRRGGTGARRPASRSSYAAAPLIASTGIAGGTS